MCPVDYVNADYSAIAHDEHVINQGFVRGRRTFPLEALFVSRRVHERTMSALSR